MRYLCSVALILAVSSPVFAANPPTVALSSQEISDGWVMLFDGESTFGWNVAGEVVVKDGDLILGGPKHTTATSTSVFGNYDLQFTSQGEGTITFRSVTGNVRLKLTGPKTSMTLEVRVGNGWNLTSTSTDAKLTGSVQTDQPATLAFEVGANQTLRIGSLKLKSAGMKPLFNGKDLTGWKLFEGDAKRKASKFDVTPAGELHVLNGPGDLQTTTAHANFCLQFDCKTNGEQLNSGIFFRCLPDQYQNGYEAQIQNGYLGTRTNPIDFGTGAIYRRVKARKVVSDDHKWFTMTFLAHGPHISTWVNGYPTVDWTDDRPADDNARKGRKTAAGHLSIQGHDPTTDILFRNLRIADIGKAK